MRGQRHKDLTENVTNLNLLHFNIVKQIVNYKVIRMKQIIRVICFLMVCVSAFAQTKTITLEVHQVIKNDGTVHISLSFSEEVYKKRKPDRSIQREPVDNIIRTEITVPTGDCVINVYQDRNGNGKCDNNLLGIPKEPVGISNWDGKGIPGNFNKHKVNINEETKTIIVNLHQL